MESGVGEITPTLTTKVHGNERILLALNDLIQGDFRFIYFLSDADGR